MPDIRRMLGERYSPQWRGSDDGVLKVPIYRSSHRRPLCQARRWRRSWTVTQIGSRSVGEKTEAELLLGFVKSLPVDSRGTARSW